MDNVAVIFKDDGSVRILHGIRPADFQGLTNVAVNPDLAAVRGIPPHHWRLEGSRVVPAPSPSEPTSSVTEYRIVVAKSFYYRQAIAVAAVSFIVSLLVKYL